MKVDTTLDASIGVVCGSSGSGKSVAVKKAVAKAPRAIIWDIDDEYSGPGGVPGVERITGLAGLARVLASRKKGRFAFVGAVAEFEGWCRAVFSWGHCLAVAEELAGVTSPGKAPQGWHTLVSRGRKRGVSLIGITQRPSESDKTIMGNASFIRVGRMARAQDRRYMAQEIDVPESLIARLKNLHYITKDMGSNEYWEGKTVVPTSGERSLTRVRITEKPLTVER